MAIMDLSKREIILGVICCVLVFFTLLSNKLLFQKAISNVINSQFQGDLKIHNSTDQDELTLALGRASMPNKTVIITTVNTAWMESGGIFDLFMKSFEIGEETPPLLNNLLVVAYDEKAFNACTQIHHHCYRLKTAGVDFSGESVFMSEDFLKMMRSRILFLTNVLHRGYTFLFSDSDIIWLRNPFQRFLRDTDLEMSCDKFSGNPGDMRNQENTGFMLVRSNNRTIQMMEVWHNSTIMRPHMHDQDVWNAIKLTRNITEIGLRARFLDTKYFSGFCQSSKDLSVVCTMHANCCRGLKAKIHDLRDALEDWTSFQSSGLNKTKVHWRAREECKRSWLTK
ncbi:hypothetical protein SUGI_0136530 [Cryptomeria japonica]|nr:hypothetical protein SUGI_0136530 [Cryptomeria japonica]